jgi:hypothetical protein
MLLVLVNFVAGQYHEYGSDDFEKHDAAKVLFTVPFRPV